MTERVTAAGRVQTFLDVKKGMQSSLPDTVITLAGRVGEDFEEVDLTVADLQALVSQARALRLIAPQAAALIEDGTR